MIRISPGKGISRAGVGSARDLGQRRLAWVMAVLMVAIFTALPKSVLAWGTDGHQIVALIAAERLIHHARAEAEGLLVAPAPFLTIAEVWP